REDLIRRHAALTDEPGNSVGDDPCLARACAREDEQWTLTVCNCFALLRVESGEIDHRGGILTVPPVHEIPAPGVNVINCTLAERGPPRDSGGSMFGSLGLPELLVIFAILLVGCGVW